MLTQEGIGSSVDHEQHVKRREVVAGINLEGIAPRNDEEGPATQKQLNFLRSLGVGDEVFLGQLGIRQASLVIEYVLEHRNDY